VSRQVIVDYRHDDTMVTDTHAVPDGVTPSVKIHRDGRGHVHLGEVVILYRRAERIRVQLGGAR